MRRVLRVLALAAATSAERPDSCAFKLVPIRDSEQSYYWPGGDDLCHVLARNSSAAQRCGKGETPAWDKTAFDVHHLCMRMASGPPHIHYMHERPNLYTRLRRLPPGNTSMVERLVAAMRGRTVVWVGDSVAGQFRKQLSLRLREVQVTHPRARRSDRARRRRGTRATLARFDRRARRHLAAAALQEKRARSDKYPERKIPWVSDHQMPLYVPPYLEFDSPKWAVWEDQLVAEASKGKGMVMIYNVGLHYNANGGANANTYNQTLTRIFKALERVTRTPPAEKRSRNVAMFMETTSQHFPTKTGGYYAEVLEERGETPIHDYTCVPAERHGYSCQLHSEWRNRVAEAIGRLFPDVPIAPMGDLTEDMWDMHPHSKDCTHWCYAPALVEAVAYLILHVVEAVDEGKGRHELDWALHARHRG